MDLIIAKRTLQNPAGVRTAKKRRSPAGVYRGARASDEVTRGLLDSWNSGGPVGRCVDGHPNDLGLTARVSLQFAEGGLDHLLGFERCWLGAGGGVARTDGDERTWRDVRLAAARELISQPSCPFDT